MYLTLLRAAHYTASIGVGQANCGNNVGCDTDLPNVGAGTGELQQILQIVFATFAVVAVLMVVIGGFRFALSDGKPDQASKARNTIIYAVIGLVITLSAEGIVTFLLDKL